MKKFLRVLLLNLDKIILAVLLIVLIGTLWTQVIRYKNTIQLIEQTKKIDTSTRSGKDLLKPLDEGIYMAKVSVDVKKTWREPYTVGKWDQLKPVEIFKTFPKPPNTMSRELKDHVQETGPSSLFDPPLYVFPIDRQPYVLGFGSKRSPYPPYRIDYIEDRDAITKRPDADDDDDDDDDDDATTTVVVEKKLPLIDMIRWAPPHKAVYPRLNISLSSVIRTDPKDKAAWDITIKVKSRTQILKVGSKIPGTDYKISDVSYEVTKVKSGSMMLEKKIFKIVIEPKDDEGTKLTLVKGDRNTRDINAKPAYEIMFFPGGKKARKIRPGRSFDVRDGARRGQFRIDVDGDDIMIVETDDGAKIGKQIKLKRYSEKEYRKWSSKRKKSSTDRSKVPTPGGPGDMGMPPGMPDGMMPPPRPKR